MLNYIMRIFKYIFKMSMLNTLISFLVIIGLVWVSQSFRSIKFIFEKGGSILDFFTLSIFSMPAWLSISVSFGVFFGIFITFMKLENDRELIAMKSSGLNSLQLSHPILAIGIIFSSILFFNFHFLLPKSYSSYKNYEDNLRYKKPQILFNENSFYHIDKKTFFAQAINGNEFDKLFIKDYSSKEQTIDIFAKKALFIAKKNDLKIKYICSSPEKLNQDEKFDVILNMEIIEHVKDVEFFLKSCSKLLKKGGIMFVATLNKTLKSYIFAIVGAEYILKWLPIGTHDWTKFINPDDLIKCLSSNSCTLERIDGMKFNIIKDEWKISSDKSVNYIAKFVKN